MSRIIAIDYGIKRCGIAVSDPLQIIASGLCTINTNEIIDFLKDYISKEHVETMVVGMPKRMNNQPSEVEIHIQQFISNVEKQIPNITIVRQDERFSSKMAFQTLIDSGVKKHKRREKELIDQVSATIILQSYMSRS